MPEQLIFTSKPTGIQPGRSGFQVVAQHNTLHPRLASALEKESVYEFADSSQALPVICKFQIFEFGSDRFHVLTRTRACGVDFTGRPNHIAHHLIFGENELPACPPAAIFALWKGWREQWDTKPRYLGGWDRVNYENEAEPFFYSRFALPAKTWKAQAGDEAAAAIPLLSECEHVVFPFPDGKEDTLIWLFLESQSLLPPPQSWELTFTNYRIENDNLSRFRWIGDPASASRIALSIDTDTVKVFDASQPLTIPEHELAEKARRPLNLPKPPTPRKQPSVISITPFDDSGPIQDELGLEEDAPPAAKPTVNEDDLLDTALSSTLPNQHDAADLDDIFGSESDAEGTATPNLNLQDESAYELPQRSWRQRFGVITLILLIAGMGGAAILYAPGLIDAFNRKADPNPVARPAEDTSSRLERTQRMDALMKDPESRFESQIGEVDAIMQQGQFLLARAYLSRYRGRPEHSETEDYQRLDSWFESQKTLLERVNRETGILAQQISRRQVLPDYDRITRELHEHIDGLAKDLQPALRESLETLQSDYETWLNKVRLKTANVPTFFIPILRESPFPKITFDAIPESATHWLASLEMFPVTAQIEHIHILVSPFRGLNQFELGSDDAIQLSLWKQSERSLISYQAGQAEVIEMLSDANNPDSFTFHWRYDPSQVPANTQTLPEPPLILQFENTLTNQSINVVMVGGISQSVTAPAEVPFSFLELDPVSYQMEVMDPVLKEKLELFLLPPERFLRLRSPDDRFHFAWDPLLSAFHLYESRELDTTRVKTLQAQISQQHARLNRLSRQETIFRSVTFLRNTPLWSLGEEILPPGTCPAELEDFQVYFEAQGRNFFEYMRAILSHFADEYTLIRPSVMEQWVAYPKDRVPQTEEEILTYRNMLLRTSKRLRSLLKQDDPNHLEYWRNFVTNFEFWLLGEHQQQLIDVLTLKPNEIALVHHTQIDQVEAELAQTRESIQALQLELQENNNLSEMEGLDRWMLEIAAMDPALQTMPLILFKHTDP